MIGSVRFAVIETATGRIEKFSTYPSQEAVDEYVSGLESEFSDVQENVPEKLTSRQYYDGSTFIDRPSVPEPTGPIYDLTALPTGTTVTVVNEAQDSLVITTLDEDLTLTDIGTYWFHVEPPFPYLPLTTTVEVV